MRRRIDQVLTSFGQAQEVFSYLAAPKGKMLRPTLVLLTFDLCHGIRFEEAINVAAGVELVHMASLIHDDVVDNGLLRRGQAALHRMYGTRIAVLAGDHLFAGAFQLFSRSETKVTRLMTTIIQDMCTGEINQLLSPVTKEEDYWNYIHKKTARLLGGCCRLGAILSDQEHRQGHLLQEFGESIGLAFQLMDDVLDYCGVEMTMGKRKGEDFNEKIWTLPVIRAYKRGLVPSSWAHLNFTDIQKILANGGILDEVWNLAATHLQNAQQIISGFSHTTAKDNLLYLLDTLIKRQS